ncbi:hypothetical protein, partial [Vibrio furnissii]|uniref:hypothetical protein n=1 Tax=Vibrio furnissii TaxID=29494 RepID=UPI001EE9E478
SACWEFESLHPCHHYKASAKAGALLFVAFETTGIGLRQLSRFLYSSHSSVPVSIDSLVLPTTLKPRSESEFARFFFQISTAHHLHFVANQFYYQSRKHCY